MGWEIKVSTCNGPCLGDRVENFCSSVLRIRIRIERAVSRKNELVTSSRNGHGGEIRLSPFRAGGRKLPEGARDGVANHEHHQVVVCALEVTDAQQAS